MKYKGKEFECGTVKVGERGQIVIPKQIRDELGINPGDNLIILGLSLIPISAPARQEATSYAVFCLTTQRCHV